jgi:hypothetical protein
LVVRTPERSPRFAANLTAGRAGPSSIPVVGLALHVEQLIREALGREPNEEPAQSPGELGGQSPPGHDDARMAPPHIEPAAVQTLEVDAVVVLPTRCRHLRRRRAVPRPIAPVARSPGRSWL